MHPTLEATRHRPWPHPDRRWVLRQRWQDLLFAHWPVPVAALRPHIPAELRIDTFDGSAWVGVVPFLMKDVALRPLPPVPGLATFPELNLRTYVDFGGKPGVWFFSLDAASGVAVRVARRFFHLPYHRARFEVDRGGDAVTFASERISEPAGLAFSARYEPTGPTFDTSSGSLGHWLTERYCFYAVDPSGRLLRTEVHHRPWPLQPARAEIERNELGRPFGFDLTDEPSLLHYSRDLEVVAWTGREASG